MQIISDNGPNFVVLVVASDVEKSVANRNITLLFDRPGAPWLGGSLECMVQLVKICLWQVLFQVIVNYEEIAVLLKEKGCILIDQPLTLTSQPLSKKPITPRAHSLMVSTLCSETKG